LEKERSDDVAVDVCNTKSVHGNLDFVQSLAPLLLNKILCFIYQNKAKIEEILMV